MFTISYYRVVSSVGIASPARRSKSKSGTVEPFLYMRTTLLQSGIVIFSTSSESLILGSSPTLVSLKTIPRAGSPLQVTRLVPIPKALIEWPYDNLSLLSL